MNRAVFLDRDNTIIENDGDLGDPAQVKLIQGAASAIASLRGLGYQIIVVSNQGGVARGTFTEADVDRVNARISELVKQMSGAWVDRYYYCPYHPEGTVKKYRREHPWRKPQPGMLLEAARDLKLDLSQCWMIGDHMRDIEAGKAAGVRTILLHPEAKERPPLDYSQLEIRMTENEPVDHASQPDFMARNLIDAVKIVAQQRKPGLSEEHRAQLLPAKAVTTTGPRRPPVAPPAPAPPMPPPATPSISAAPELSEGDDEPSADPSARTLRQILHELRKQRATTGEARRADWSPPMVFAIVLQMLAVTCLLAGLLLGGQALPIWIGVALFVQLATIAALLFAR